MDAGYHGYVHALETVERARSKTWLAPLHVVDVYCLHKIIKS